MSSPAYVVVPVNEGKDGKRTVDHDQLAAVIESSLKEQAEGETLKGIMGNHSDSLYKYLSWEDPIRTLGGYGATMAVLFAAHYIPWTQFALKYVATALGAVSLIEFAGRSFTSNTLSARLRPEGGYKKIPELTLNATLHDVHDLLQSAVVEVQKIIYGEDLAKTFTAFLTVTGAFWLIKYLNPFWIIVSAVTSVFMATLVNSQQGRETVKMAKDRGMAAANTVAENGKQLAHDGKIKAGEFSSSAQQTASQAASNISNSASNAYGKASDTAGQMSSSAQQTASNAYAKASDTAGQMSSSAQQTASNAYAKASDTAGQMSSNAQQTASNAHGKASDTASNLSSKAQGGAAQAKDGLNSQFPGTSNTMGNAAQQARETAGSASNKISQLLGGQTGGGAKSSTEQSGSPSSGNGLDTDSSDADYTNFRATSGGKVFTDVDDAGSKYVAADDAAGKPGITNRTRGDIALGETVGAVAH